MRQDPVSKKREKKRKKKKIKTQKHKHRRLSAHLLYRVALAPFALGPEESDPQSSCEELASPSETI